MKTENAAKPSPAMTRLFRRTRMGVLLALGGATALLAAFQFSEDLLCLESGPRTGEVIIVLGGESVGRANQALELYKAGAAPRIIVSGDGESEPIRELLIRGGVPSEVIELEDHSKNTKQNAEFTTRLLEQHQVQHAIIVTSWYHSRRAMNCFRFFAPGIKFSSAPCHFVQILEVERNHVLQEYLKTGWYIFRYGISPWQASHQ